MTIIGARAGSAVAALVLALAVVGCGDTTDEAVTTTLEPASEEAPSASALDEEMATEETATENDDRVPSTDEGETFAVDLAAMPASPAPEPLIDAVLPTDADGVVSLYEELPAALLGGDLRISADARGVLAAQYLLADRVTSVGFQAMDVPSSFFADVLPEPTVEYLVAVFAQGGDWDVEAFGHDRDRYWVLWNTTGSGEGIDGVELISSLTFGDAGSPWAFIIGAPDPDARDELLAAFVTASDAAAEPAATSPDEEAAAAALLTLADVDEIGPGWTARPSLPPSGGFSDMMAGVMAGESACDAARAWIDAEGVTLTGLIDALGVDAVATADSQVFVPNDDPLSDVQHTVLVYESADDLAATFDRSRQIGWVECIAAVYDDLNQLLYDQSLPGVGVTVESVETRSLDLGDDSFAMRATLTLTAPDGDTRMMVHDIVILAIGRAASATVQISFDGAIDDTFDDVVRLATDRVTNHFSETGDGS